MTVRLDLSTADMDVLRATGLNVYGPTANKVYASTTSAGPGPSRTAAFSSTEPGTYLVQLFNYSSTAVPFALATNQAALTSNEPAPSQAPGRIIALDPGHGGREIGAVSPEGDLLEKAINLKIALKLADLLRADGHQAILTRDVDRSVTPNYRSGDVSPDLQARIDAANAAGAHLFISIHNNGGPRSESGTEVWYNRARPFADRNLALAQLVQANLLQQIRGLGYPVRGPRREARYLLPNGSRTGVQHLRPRPGHGATPAHADEDDGGARRVPLHEPSGRRGNAPAGTHARRHRDWLPGRRQGVLPEVP